MDHFFRLILERIMANIWFKICMNPGNVWRNNLNYWFAYIIFYSAN